MSANGYVAWDAPLGKWLPTEPDKISPDGAEYMPQDDFVIADAATGAVLHRIADSDGNLVVGYTSTSVYLAASGKLTVPGLWRIDTSTGVVTRLKSSVVPVRWMLANDEGAWGITGDATNGTRIEYLDFASGTRADLYQEAEPDDAVIDGYVGSGVLVTLFSSSLHQRLGVLHRDGSMSGVNVPAALDGKDFGSNHLAADGAILFSGLGYGVAAYDDAHGFQLIVSGPADLLLAGACKH